MEILKWKKTKHSHVFKYNNKPVHCERWESKRFNIRFKVVRAVSQKFWYTWTGMAHHIQPDLVHPNLDGRAEERDPLDNSIIAKVFITGAEEFFGDSKRFCSSIDEGKQRCQEHWKQLLEKELFEQIEEAL